tara:strand:+ start:511 stop:1215 length:705 start_codon:yes stop_codon:yes gene_type:complete
MKTSVIIPCFNEKENLEDLFSSWMKELLDKNIEVIFVNNGSLDDSYRIFLELSKKFNHQKDNFKILNLKKNVGYGGGIQAGLNIATGDVLSWCHADNQVEVKDVIKLINYYNSHIDKNFILKGKRTNRPLLDRIFTYLMSLLVFLTTRKHILDINAQPKIFSKNFYTDKNSYSKDFLFDLDFLLSIKKKKIDIVEKTITIQDRKFGKAKGGGSFYGKLKLSIKTIIYLLRFKDV